MKISFSYFFSLFSLISISCFPFPLTFDTFFPNEYYFQKAREFMRENPLIMMPYIKPGFKPFLRDRYGFLHALKKSDCSTQTIFLNFFGIHWPCSSLEEFWFIRLDDATQIVADYEAWISRTLQETFGGIDWDKAVQKLQSTESIHISELILSDVDSDAFRVAAYLIEHFQEGTAKELYELLVEKRFQEEMVINRAMYRALFGKPLDWPDYLCTIQ